MKSIRIGIFSKDKIYVNRITRAVQQEYENEIKILSYDSFFDLNLAVKNNSLDIVLMDENAVLDGRKISDVITVIYLSDIRKFDLSDDMYILYKYQHVEELISAIEEIYDKNLIIIKSNKLDSIKTKIVLFVQAGGCVGNTTAAISCCRKIATKGKRVLYLNLESDGEANLYLKSKNYDQEFILEDEYGVLFFEKNKAPITNLDIFNCKKLSFFEDVEKKKMFDYIVIDAKIDVIKSKEIIRRVLYMYVVSDGSKHSLAKLEHLLRIINKEDIHNNESILESIKILYNKFAFQKSEYLDDESFEMCGMIPEFVDASTEEIKKEIVKMKIFDAI